MSMALPFKVAALATAIALTACGGDSSSSKADGLDNNKTGTAKISTRGGDGAYAGSSGGYINITKAYSHAPLSVNTQGTPDADYDLPDYEVNLGANPLTISASTTINEYDGNDLTNGQLYFYSNAIYRYDGAVDESEDQIIGKMATIITGVEIQAGATLAIASNNSQVTLYLMNDFVNNGSLTTANLLGEGEVDTDLRPSLSINPFAYSGSGSVDLSGQSSDYPNGRNFTINANYVFNSGTINASGADVTAADATAGEAGNVYIHADYALENTGGITANGGNSADGYAQEGGDIDLRSSILTVNTGALTTNGGTGKSADTSSSGGSELFSGLTLINTGDITANGTSSTGDNNGGDGGYIGLTMYSDSMDGISSAESRLINTGNLVTTGGAPGGENAGGDGGEIQIYAAETEDGAEGYGTPAMFAVSGNLIAEGYSSADAYIGGSGGYINIWHYASVTSEYETLIVGYESINTSGGSGADGASAGNIGITSFSSDDHDTYLYAPAASIDVATNITANGGNSVFNSAYPTAQGTAGDAGDVTIESTAYSYSLQAEIGDTTASFEGDLALNGGNATGFITEDFTGANSSYGGDFSISAPDDVSAKGTLVANGGSAEGTATTDTNYRGNDAGDVYAESALGKVNVNMDITLNGGNGGNDAGWAGFVWLTSADKATLKGDLSLAGGNATATVEDSNGGFGGQVYMYSANDKYASVNKDAVLTAGTGGTPGFAGGITTGAQCALGNCISYDWID